MTTGNSPKIRISIFAIFLLLNIVALFCIFNPWVTDWQRQAIVLLVFELFFLLGIGLPVFCYHFFKMNKSFKQSLADSLETVLDFLCGWV